jgi:hypothetical protein
VPTELGLFGGGNVVAEEPLGSSSGAEPGNGRVDAEVIEWPERSLAMISSTPGNVFAGARVSRGDGDGDVPSCWLASKAS